MRSTRIAFAVAALAVMAFALPAQAGNPFSRSTTTANGYHTFDADQIDIEKVSRTGAGVYVAVLDTGLVPNWKDYFPDARVAQELGVGFDQPIQFVQKKKDPCGVNAVEGRLQRGSYIGSRTSSHGTHVASTIIGYSYRSNSDASQGFPLPAIQVRGIAPRATIIPVRVLNDYTISLPGCTDPDVSQGQVNFGTDATVIAGIKYVTSLKLGALKDSPVVINMSLGGEEPGPGELAALDAAIDAGVIIVASAGNEGEAGMGYPGAYGPVISVGSAGWTGQWLDGGAGSGAPANEFRYRMFWLQNEKGDGSTGNLQPPLFPGSGQVGENGAIVDETFVSDFSSREKDGQQLDVLAPGDYIRGPFPGLNNYNHLPWWSKGLGDLLGKNTGNFYYVGGTSMASPHVAALAALMLEKNPGLRQGQVSSILKGSALAIPAGSAQVWNPFLDTPGFETISWGADATGSGLVQADAALADTPNL
jgi:subtilisin family serine protease